VTARAARSLAAPAETFAGAAALAGIHTQSRARPPRGCAGASGRTARCALPLEIREAEATMPGTGAGLSVHTSPLQEKEVSAETPTGARDKTTKKKIDWLRLSRARADVPVRDDDADRVDKRRQWRTASRVGRGDDAAPSPPRWRPCRQAQTQCHAGWGGRHESGGPRSPPHPTTAGRHGGGPTAACSTAARTLPRFTAPFSALGRRAPPPPPPPPPPTSPTPLPRLLSPPLSADPPPRQAWWPTTQTPPRQTRRRRART